MRQQETQVLGRWITFLVFLLILAMTGWNVISQSAALYRTTPEFRKMEPTKIVIVNDNGEHITIDVRIADELDEKAAGFAGIGAGVIQRSVIMSVYARDTQAGFNMRDVEVPLELAFINAEGKVLEIIQTEPHTPEPYTFGVPIRYVLETPAGFFAPLHISNINSTLDTESIDLSR